MGELVSTVRAAKMLGMSAQTVRRWIQDGALAHIVTPGGRYFIPIEELQRITTVIPATNAEVVDDVETESGNAVFPPELF
ncbi:helix-turn-helix domain-containing protein [uncultured Mobiluncus sp.]|uniref:MerR family transcriptional regulator n=1 Tax=uncultured Mobiluncus sp. TaxID=293425 RepID=UPI0025EF4B52|nr:helix-turn-helix domain-containing protein [uncultured Mobiluncus sp.]